MRAISSNRVDVLPALTTSSTHVSGPQVPSECLGEHLVDIAISSDRVQLVLFAQPPDCPASTRNLSCLSSSKHNDIGFDFTSVAERRTRFVESLESRATLYLYLTIDNHRISPDI